MVGGKAEVFESVKDILLSMGGSAVLIGDIGSGNTAKLEVKLTKNTMDRVRAFYLLEKAIVSAATDVATAVVKGVAGGKK